MEVSAEKIFKDVPTDTLRSNRSDSDSTTAYQVQVRFFPSPESTLEFSLPGLNSASSLVRFADYSVQIERNVDVCSGLFDAVLTG